MTRHESEVLRMESRVRGRQAMAGLFVLFLGIYALTNPGQMNAVDTRPALLEAAALVEEGTVQYSQLDRSEFGEDLDRILHIQPVNKYGFSHNLLYVPLYVLGSRAARSVGRPGIEGVKFVISFANVLAGAFIVATLLGILLLLDVSLPVGIFTTLLIGLGSFLWPTTGVSYSDPLQVAFVLLVFLQALRVERRGGKGAFHLLGIFAVLALLSKTSNALVMGPLLIIPLLRMGNRRRALLIGLFWSAVYLLLQGIVNEARFGSPLDFGYYSSEKFFAGDPIQGLRLYAISPDRGMLWFFPLVVLALPGMLLFAARRPRIGIPVAAALVLTVLFHASIKVPVTCLGPRYFLVLVPLLGLGLAESVRLLWPILRSKWVRGVMVALGALWLLPMAILPWYAPQVLAQALREEGGCLRVEPRQFLFLRILSERFGSEGCATPLAAFSEERASGSVDWSAWEKSGWSVWWMRGRQVLPRSGLVAAFGASIVGILVGVLLLRRATGRLRVRAKNGSQDGER